MRKLIDNKYKFYFELWSNCIKEANKELVLSCQHYAVKHIVADKASFMDHSDNVNMFAKNKVGADFKTVRTILFCIATFVCSFVRLSSFSAKLAKSCMKLEMAIHFFIFKRQLLFLSLRSFFTN